MFYSFAEKKLRGCRLHDRTKAFLMSEHQCSITTLMFSMLKKIGKYIYVVKKKIFVPFFIGMSNCPDETVGLSCTNLNGKSLLFYSRFLINDHKH